MVPREHVYHIEGCQFITEIHILKVRLKMSELFNFFPVFLIFFYCFLFIHLFSYLFIYHYHSLLLLLHVLLLLFVFLFLLPSAWIWWWKKKANKQTNKKHQIPSASLTVLQFVEGINMKKQI